jgi:hypothetical protein
MSRSLSSKESLQGKKEETQPFDEAFYDEDEYEDEIRECDNSCSHFDSINLCCWLVTSKSLQLCTDVQEGDLCKYGLTRDD